jgi:glutamyl/glutaminyl-tRNA synthetase
LDKDGRRLAKRDADLSLRGLRAQGYSPEEIIAQLTKRTLEHPQRRGDSHD